MEIFKNITVAVLCFFLFLSIAVFGIAFTVNSTALNPDFVAGEINNLEVSTLVREFTDIESPPEMPEMEEVIFDTIESLEPVIKERLDETIHAVYEYMPDNFQDVEMNKVLRENFLTSGLVSSLIENIDVPELAGLLITQQFAEQIPIEIDNFDDYVADAIEAAEPAIKAQLVIAADPVFDYILGISQTLNVSISLDEVTESLKDSIRQSLLDSPPPELASVPREMRAELFDAFYDEISELLPSSFVIDESVISPDVPADIEKALANAEDSMAEAGKYISYFKTVYIILIIFMVFLVLAIILIIRDVRKITRRLGVPLITYGLIEYAGIWVARLISRGTIKLPEMMPQYFQEWMFEFTDHLLRPLEIFSITLLIIGIILVIVSFVYKHESQSELPVP